MTFLLALILSLQGILDDHAQDHAEEMATRGELYHSDITPFWKTECVWIGENVYRGPNPEKRWEAYETSPSHRTTMNLGRTHHAAGKTKTVTGVWYVADVFCQQKQAPKKGTPTPEKKPLSPPDPPSTTTRLPCHRLI